MAAVASALGQLVEVAAGEHADPEGALQEAQHAVRQLRQGGGWSMLQDEDVSAVAVTRALGDLLKQQDDPVVRANAAIVYASLLTVRDAPAGTLCEPYAFSAFVQCLKGICLPVRSKSGQQTQATQGDGAGPSQGHAAAADLASIVSPVALLEDLGAFLQQHSMRGSPDMVMVLLDALVDMTQSTVAGGGRQDKAGKRGAASQMRANGLVCEVAFALLPQVVDPHHGSVAQLAAVLCHRLAPTLMTEGAAKRGAGTDRRGAALSLIESLLRKHESARACRPALMRQLLLRVPDRADSRQLAVAAVQTLIAGSTPEEVRSFCLFLHRLSRVTKAGSRQVAVEMASALLLSLPHPFALDTAGGVYQRLTSGAMGAGEQLEAPWSAVCLAILVQRSNDKSASVRSRAINCLADCVAGFADALQGSSGPAAAAEAAALVPALCAAKLMQVKVSLPGGARAKARQAAAERGGDSGEEGEGAAAGEGAGAAQLGDDADEEEEQVEPQEGEEPAPPPEAVVTATISGVVSLDLSWLVSMCHVRCRDDKAAVRKAALLLLQSALELCATVGGAAAGGAAAGPSTQDVVILEEATADPLVSVRKAALQVVTSLVRRYPAHTGMAGVWVRSVMPLIRDPESSVQDAVLDQLSSLLLEPLSSLGAAAARAGGRGGAGRAGAGAAAEEAAACVRPRLTALAHMGRAASSCLARALGALAAKKLLKGPQVAAGAEALLATDSPLALTALVAETGDEGAERREAGAEAQQPEPRRGQQQQQRQAVREAELAARDAREGAWMVLAEVAGHDPAAPSWKFLQRCWGELRAAAAGGGGGGAAAQEGAMLLWVISHAASRFPEADAASLAAELLQAVLGFNLPCAAVAAHLAALHRLTQGAGGRGEVGAPARWCARVLEAAEEVLAQALEARGTMDASLTSRTQLALFTLGEVALLREVKLPGGAAVKVQALTSAAGQRARGGQAGVLCGHAWTCLGKLCMVDEGLAKKCVPLLAQEMSGNPSPVVRMNLLVGLSDMVVQFTGLADAHVTRIAAMVRDPHELVRRQALALLANLLLRDYVKWRGALVHRFLLALVDESGAVRSLAQYLLGDSLAAKAPMLAYNHFVESFFALNDCKAGLHASKAAAGGSELQAELALHAAMEGGATFHLKGSSPTMRAKRDVIYTALARRMSHDHRFASLGKLVTDVVAGVCDGALPLPECDEVLGDALRMMASKDMKANANRIGGGADEEANGGEVEQTQEAMKARGKLMGTLMRKHLAEVVVPHLVELRSVLQAKKHPLLGSLMMAFAALLREHKAEVEDIVVSDKQLAREILHDIKHYDSLVRQQQHQQQAAEAAERAAAAERTAAAGGGDGSNAARAGGSAAGPSDAAGGMLPPAERPRRASNALPGSTPLAAEVLATAAKSRRQQALQQGQLPPSRNHTPFGRGGAAPEGGAAAAKTPMAALLGAGSMKTPRTGLATGGRGLGATPLPSPAPLSARARIAPQGQAGAGARAGVASPSAAAIRVRSGADAAAGAGAAGGSGGAGAAGAEAEAPLTVILPSPLPEEAQPGPHRRALWPKNTAHGGGQDAGQGAAAAGAGAKAKSSAAAAQGAGAGQGAESGQGDDVAGAAGSKRSLRSRAVKEEPGAAGAAVKEETAAAGVVGPAGGRRQGSKRRAGA